MKKYNVGIVGYGWVASAHIPAINATTQGQVTAICSSRKLDAKQLSAQHGGSITAYTDVAEMLANPDIDVVSVCSYPYDHAKQVIAAAKASAWNRWLMRSMYAAPAPQQGELRQTVVMQSAKETAETRLKRPLSPGAP